MEPNAKWMAVVLSCSVINNRSNNGFGSGLKISTKSSENGGINLNSLFVRKDDNFWEWQLEDDGKFSVCLLQMLIDCNTLPAVDSETIWVNWATSKANVHLWRTLIDCLVTMGNLCKRGITLQSDMCSSNHIFGECSTAKLVSAHISQWVDWWPSKERTVSEMWDHIDSNKSNDVNRKVRRVIWSQRNSKVYNGSMKKEKEMAEEIKFIAFDWIRCRTKFGITWEIWCCNPVKAVATCIALAPR
ncbi:hypothetical protein OSB04_012884 [Centaurea solstitialis]|uniref:Uncharacterized protein n=1 Tax=Centaurea solstitialis TaxID=347529 RepID=A0AA38TC64_9ASTR|nr:hypothetical protein OSB04_012884 [Centaurea solstitialis]